MPSPEPRIIAIGDIHGNAPALRNLLNTLDPQPQDTFIFLGDYVDRGPDSKAVIDCLLDLRQRRRCRFIQGNHEEIMRAALHEPEIFSAHWLGRYGGQATCESYGAKNHKDLMQKLPSAHRDFLENLESMIETGQAFFVHAGYDRTHAPEAQTADTLRYTFLKAEDATPGKRIVCGHTPQKSGSPLHLSGLTCIDTSAAGLVTAYDITNEIFWSADTSGPARAVNPTTSPAPASKVQKCKEARPCAKGPDTR